MNVNELKKELLKYSEDAEVTCENIDGHFNPVTNIEIIVDHKGNFSGLVIRSDTERGLLAQDGTMIKNESE